MDKITELAQFVSVYGYTAIFLFVFLQELGVPNPITNELVLLYAGYLSYTGVLSLPKIIAVTISADFIGTSILYFLCYAFGKYLANKRPKWFPISAERIETIKQRIHKGDMWNIYFGRLIPFLRGYVSIGAGLVEIKPLSFLTMVLISAATWSGGLVLLGRSLGPYWLEVTQHMGVTENIIAIVVFAVIMFFAGRYVTIIFFPSRKRISKEYAKKYRLSNS